MSDNGGTNWEEIRSGLTYGQPRTNSTANPGYGNDMNVGYSPGQLGGIPADITKFQYQQRQYEEMYGAEDRRIMASIPLSNAVMTTPLSLVLCFAIVVFASGFSFSFFNINWWIGAFMFVVVWGFALYWIKRLTFDLWITAFVLHRRKMLARGVDRFPWIAFIDEEPEKFAAFHKKYPLSE